MSYAAIAQDTYTKSTRSNPTPKMIEVDAFTRITKLLQNLDTTDTSSFPKTVEAVHMNKKLWSVLAAAIAEDANQLPSDLKVGLLNLALFTENHSRKVMDKLGDVAPLIEINLAVLRGLKSKGVA